jgi:hypothetical protein
MFLVHIKYDFGVINQIINVTTMLETIQTWSVMPEKCPLIMFSRRQPEKTSRGLIRFSLTDKMPLTFLIFPGYC